MSKENKMKGRRTIGRRFFDEEEPSSIVSAPAIFKTLEELFDIFIKAKEVEGLRERTLTDHRNNFRYFLEFLKIYDSKVKFGSGITIATLREYIHYMKSEKGIWDSHKWLAEKHAHKKGLSPVTINVRLRSLNCFLKFLFDEGYIPKNPGARIKLLQTEQDTIEAFTEEQIRVLLEQPNQRTFVGYRDYVLMLLMLDTGIRVKEALNLKIEYLNYEQRTILVPAHVAKNKQARILSLSKKTAKAIHTLIKENSVLEDGCPNIFITNYGVELGTPVIRAGSGITGNGRR